MSDGEKLARIAEVINLRSTIKHYLLVGLAEAGKDGPVVAIMMDLIDRGCCQQIHNIIKEYTKEGE